MAVQPDAGTRRAVPVRRHPRTGRRRGAPQRHHPAAAGPGQRRHRPSRESGVAARRLGGDVRAGSARPPATGLPAANGHAGGGVRLQPSGHRRDGQGRVRSRQDQPSPDRRRGVHLSQHRHTVRPGLRRPDPARPRRPVRTAASLAEPRVRADSLQLHHADGDRRRPRAAGLASGPQPVGYGDDHRTAVPRHPAVPPGRPAPVAIRITGNPGMHDARTPDANSACSRPHASTAQGGAAGSSAR